MEAKEFYSGFETNMVEVNRKIGICRKSLARLPSGGVRKDTAKIVLNYLEKKNIQDYQDTITTCRNELHGKINSMKLEIKEAWKKYLAREELLDEYYRMYDIPRKGSIIKRVKITELLRAAMKGI